MIAWLNKVFTDFFSVNNETNKKVTVVMCILVNIYTIFIFVRAYIRYNKMSKSSLEDQRISRRMRNSSLDTIKLIYIFITILFIAIIIAVVQVIDNFNFTIEATIFGIVLILLIIGCIKLFFYVTNDFLNNVLQKEFGIFLVLAPTLNIFSIRSIVSLPAINGSSTYLWGYLRVFSGLLIFVITLISIYCLYKGIVDTIVNPFILMKYSDGNTAIIKLVICWFMLIYLNSVFVLYTVSLVFPNSFIDNSTAPQIAGNTGFFTIAYFTLITLLTIGYGDVAPKGVGRLAVCIVALIGAFYSIIAIASIISNLKKVRNNSDD